MPCDAVTSTFNRIVVVCRDTNVLLLLLHVIGDKQELEAWMVSRTARQKKCYHLHQILSQLALTFYDSTSSLDGFGKKKSWWC